MKENVILVAKYKFGQMEILLALKSNRKFCIWTFENTNGVIKGHAQHDKDQLFYNWTDYNLKIFVTDN